MAHDETRDEVQLKDSGRRKLLKAATVAGGAVAASALLPGSWRKPVATVGGLPAHAQTSQSITLRDPAAAYMAWPIPLPDRQAAADFEVDIGVYCRYEDTLGEFGLDHRLTYRVTPMNGTASADGACGQEFTYTLKELFERTSGTDAQGSIQGDKYEGRIWVAVHGGCSPPDSITFSIHKGAAHVSNEVTVRVKGRPE
jgi:hypothetical protein